MYICLLGLLSDSFLGRYFGRFLFLRLSRFLFLFGCRLGFCDKLIIADGEIGKERIRRAGKKILEELATKKAENGLFDKESEPTRLDVGFRVLKLDTSNMQDVYYTPEDSSAATLFDDNVKPDRTPEDLLFQVMLEYNLPLSAKIERKTIAGKEVFSVNDDYLIACFDENVNETVITEVAKRKPLYFIMRDSSLSSDQVADNFEQIFNSYSKDTIRRIL